MNQTFKVAAQGLIEGGTVSYSVDPTGLIEFSETIVAGIGPFTQTDSNSGALKIDPSLLLSKNIKPGLKLKMGPVSILISDLRDVAAVAVISEDKSLSGSAELDLSGVYLKITHVTLSGTVQGHDVTLEFELA